MRAVAGDDAEGTEAARGSPAEEAIAATAIFAEVERLGVVDSTNRVAADAARGCAPEGFVVVADEQTEGRGRLGRRWVAPAGSAVLCSLVFRPALFASELHLLTMTVALAARDACRRVAGIEARLKWPNDLEVGERKLAGILSETVPGPSRPGGPNRAMVVGVGINVTWPTDDAVASLDDEEVAVAATATSLAREGAAGVDREVLIATLLRHVNVRYARLRRPGGRDSLLAEYRDACSTIGRTVRVDLARGSLTGQVLGVSSNGRLQVDDGVAVREVEAGDVVHLRTGPDVHPGEGRSS